MTYPGNCPFFRESVGLTPLLFCSIHVTMFSSTQKSLRNLQYSGASLHGLLCLVLKTVTCTKLLC
jgi:hypothetical protein